jgi:hypothetical protein
LVIKLQVEEKEREKEPSDFVILLVNIGWARTNADHWPERQSL